ncbi:MAG: S-layer homology domain-containing protein [Clostridia bacterium]|nr:S-layer homology domain-containing protein [Clostridia bacterium]
MKKIIFAIIFVFIICISAAFALTNIVNPNAEFIKSNEIEKPPFSDLYIEVYDERGKLKLDYQTKEQVFKYHSAINEIDKATRITIDNKGTKLISGYEDGTFRPNNNITRGEFIKIAIGVSVNKSFDFTRYDTPFEHWAAPYVAVAELHGVLDENQFTIDNINEPITRLEAILILSKIQVKMKDIPKFTDGYLPNFTDIDGVTEEEKSYIKHACRYDLFQGMLPTDANMEVELRPHDKLTRADATRAIMRVY